VERIFFPDGLESGYLDDDEQLTAREVAEYIWSVIQHQREIPTVLERLMYQFNNYAIRDPEDSLAEMNVTKAEQQRILDLIEREPEAGAAEFVQLVLDRARSQGATMRCFPAHDTNEVYCIDGASGVDSVHDFLFGNFDFVQHLPFITVMDS